ncbi:sugar transport protein 13-like [Prunus yedoensis var. nudiflora]|uniref:Sugar transport protein 13-like n=1 Tax=Prunus yedoensis var. nudiflora TaxID=2094558 RepID=A0A314Y544_PRUYE|nr:sugar transport protein 13-like [Prunus yedoensis var. nudiflora]
MFTCPYNFQQFTGINAIMFYTLQFLFQTWDLRVMLPSTQLLSQELSMFLSTVVINILCRQSWSARAIVRSRCPNVPSQLVVAIIMGFNRKDHSKQPWPCLGNCCGVMRTFPLEARSAGQSVAVCTNMLFNLCHSTAFLSMLCNMKFGIFLFFTFWVFVMTIFVVVLIPETKGVPIEEMTERVWKQHWFWKRFMDDFEE